jgi:membrane-associated phospholipid phosphatase
MIIPFRNRHRETLLLTHLKWLSLITLILLIISYFYLDRTLAQYFEYPPALLYTFASFLTNLIEPKVHYFTWPLIFFFFCFILKKPQMGNRFLLFVVAIPVANLIGAILKIIIGRARPEVFLSKGFFGFECFTHANAFLSFPSGHAITIGALMGAIACFYPRYSYLFLILSFLLAFTRVILDYHYLSDIIGSIFIGAVIAQWVYTLMQRSTSSNKRSSHGTSFSTRS